MITKLTLTIEQEIIELAKKYANKEGKSLSSIIENYLKMLVGKDKNKEELSPATKRLRGAIKLSEDFDYKKMLEEGINKKYSK